jgi:uncharacterized protein
MNLARLVAGLAGMALIGSMLSGCVGQGAAAADKPPAGITVIGEGQVYAVPDIARITFGVETTGQTAKAAMDENARSMNQVIDKLKTLGLADRDIQTSGINVYPLYEEKTPAPGATTPTVAGYRANNSITVSIGDLKKASDVLDAVVAAGVTNVSGLTFDIKSDAKLRQQALAEAGKQAQEKAKAIADSLGVKITSLASVTEDYSSSPRPMPLAARSAAAPADSTPVSPGELTITARLQVTYNIQ